MRLPELGNFELPFLLAGLIIPVPHTFAELIKGSEKYERLCFVVILDALKSILLYLTTTQEMEKSLVPGLLAYVAIGIISAVCAVQRDN